MKIRDYVESVANLLSLWDSNKVDLENVENNDTIIVGRINRIQSMVNGIICEIANFFVPLIVQKQVETSDGVVLFSSLGANIVSIEKVVSKQGKEIGFKVYHDKIVMSENSGTIYCRITPKTYNYNDEIDYTDFEVPKKVIVYGAAAEFCLTEGMFDEAVVWHEKYREQLKFLTKPKNYNTAKRTWA